MILTSCWYEKASSEVYEDNTFNVSSGSPWFLLHLYLVIVVIQISYAMKFKCKNISAGISKSLSVNFFLN